MARAYDPAWREQRNPAQLNAHWAGGVPSIWGFARPTIGYILDSICPARGAVFLHPLPHREPLTCTLSVGVGFRPPDDWVSPRITASLQDVDALPSWTPGEAGFGRAVLRTGKEGSAVRPFQAFGCQRRAEHNARATGEVRRPSRGPSVSSLVTQSGGLPPMRSARRSAIPCLVEWLRCTYCGKLIGMWEPMVVCADGVTRETSILNEQSEGDGRPAGDCYHSDCFRSMSSSPGAARRVPRVEAGRRRPSVATRAAQPGRPLPALSPQNRRRSARARAR